MGAITPGTAVVKEDVGKSAVVVAPLTMSGSYATGGDTIDGAAVEGLRQGIVNHVVVQETVLYRFEWDNANKKLIAYVKTTAALDEAEVANAVDLSAEVPTAVIYGR